MISYGKTWHVWHTGTPGQPGVQLPLGPAMLAWSFGRDGELIPQLQAGRDERMKVDSAAKRKDREDLRKLAKPQSGVDDLKGKYGRPTTDIPGVVDVRAAQGGKP